jgi:hypothetical protein
MVIDSATYIITDEFYSYLEDITIILRISFIPAQLKPHGIITNDGRLRAKPLRNVTLYV